MSTQKVSVVDESRRPSFTIVMLAWPVFIEQILVSLVSYVDTAMVGSMGANAVAYTHLDVYKRQVGDRVDACGTSKGKGYAGTIKRYHFSRLKETHGSGPVARHAGSMGACSDPSRVMKGKKLPGHMGVERVTVQNLSVVKVDAENNLIALKGAIPGPKGGIVYLTDSVKKA